MTTPNKITILRMALLPVFVIAAICYGHSVEQGEPLAHWRWIAIITFVVAGLSDGIDGYIARRYNQTSPLGVILDPIADKSLMFTTIITLSISKWSGTDGEYARFPIWFPLIVIGRDIILVVGFLIIRSLKGTVNVKPRWTGKVATFFQIAAISCLMLQLHFLPLNVIVALACIFTFISGVHYVIDGIRQLPNRQSTAR